MDVLVSVCCITYNHENYIRDAIEAFLMQKTDFPIEIIIHDDASTDKTADIIREYEKKHPGIIRPIFQEVNQYSQGKKPSIDFVIPQCRGKYIAWCEGDDFWTDPYKLQKQAIFLESNNDFVGIGSNYMVVDPQKSIIKRSVLRTAKLKINSQNGNISTLDGLPKTLTVLYRNVNSVFRQLKLMQPVFNNDELVAILMRQHGKIALLNDVCGAYRLNTNSIYGPLNYIKKMETTLKSLLIIQENLKNFDIKYDLTNRVQNYYSRLFAYHLSKGQFDNAFQYFKRISVHNRLNVFNLTRFVLHSLLKK